MFRLVLANVFIKPANVIIIECRFDYRHEFLTWALQPPGWKKVWHCGVRVVGNRKLVGFISAVPANIRIRDQ